MNHKEKLLQVFSKASSSKYISDIPQKYIDYVNVISEKVFTQKGVYTVLVTLITHKILHPAQDIRYHQDNMKGGFSGRSIDTKYITPTLKELGLPSMAESGWLTRSLEQPYPYTLDYNGKISDKEAKSAFLHLLDYAQKNANKAEEILLLLLNKVREVQSRNKINIIPLDNPDELTIKKIIYGLSEHFSFNYKTFGGAKLPVLAFYAIYRSLIREVKRYDGCKLKVLGSHTACDRTSKTAGDIEIFKDNKLFEAVEIKDKDIDITIVRVAVEKIIQYNPLRYYILTHKMVKEDDIKVIEKLVGDIKVQHGCQIIINGVLPTIKYYLRLISSPEEFVKTYSDLVAEDTELKAIHKEIWNKIIEGVFNR